MRNNIDIAGFLLGWIAIIGQFILLIQNRQADIPETIIRFFSFFTILTNILVALYFTSRFSIFKNTSLSKLSNSGNLTALTAFILVVGLVYQIILRGTWQPTGLQIITDELLHSVIPLFVFLYWMKFADKNDLIFKNIKIWFWYPVVYFLFIIIRGHFSNFYPYPFVDVSTIGYPQVLINATIVSLFFIFIMGTLIFIGNKTRKS
ncbi:Pr6Pr family membrane protein [Flavobacterium facile]|uniref:Pr6Pr family membrane protein n=1 Tax=Flavobacterium facile TaxID=2893174 RepID=UPI002E79BD7E|nr:Pr6Pr family membrane protein [Flavobacterium sp. T-12]